MGQGTRRATKSRRALWPALAAGIQLNSGFVPLQIGQRWIHAIAQRPHCVAGHVGLELRNVDANYPFEKSRRFAEIQPNFGHGDHSRLSCGATVWPIAMATATVSGRPAPAVWTVPLLSKGHGAAFDYHGAASLSRRDLEATRDAGLRASTVAAKPMNGINGDR